MLYDLNDTQNVLGPITHGKTVSIGMAPYDSNLVAVTGWASIERNTDFSEEHIFVTRSAQKGAEPWEELTGNLKEVMYGKGLPLYPSARLSSPVFIDNVYPTFDVLLAGTATGEEDLEWCLFCLLACLLACLLVC